MMGFRKSATGGASRRQRLAEFLRLVAMGAAILATGSTNSAARVWRVLPDGTGDAPFIQAAVDSAADGDVVLVAAGEYLEDGRIEVMKSIEVISESGPSVTIISPLLVRDTNSVTIRGFVITALPQTGYAIFASGLTDLTLQDCWIEGFRFPSAISNTRTRVTVEGCRFRNNDDPPSHEDGGGALLVDALSADVVIRRCWFEGNRTHSGDTEAGFGGGALRIETGRGQVLIEENVFLHNTAPAAGGAVCLDPEGGEGYFRIYRNTFVGNASSDAALYFRGDGEVAGNIFYKNDCLAHYAPYYATDSWCSCNILWGNRMTPEGNQHAGWCFIPARGDRLAVVDPRFCYPRLGDFDVATSSPALPENYPPDFLEAGCTGTIGALGWGCAEVPVLQRSWGEIKHEFRSR